MKPRPLVKDVLFLPHGGLNHLQARLGHRRAPCHAESGVPPPRILLRRPLYRHERRRHQPLRHEEPARRRLSIRRNRLPAARRDPLAALLARVQLHHGLSCPFPVHGAVWRLVHLSGLLLLFPVVQR